MYLLGDQCRPKNDCIILFYNETEEQRNMEETKMKIPSLMLVAKPETAENEI